MSQIMQLNVSDIMPEKKAVLRNQGIPEGAYPAERENRIVALLAEAMDVFADSAKPVGISSELSIKECETIFYGEGKNEKDTPIEHIFPQA
ncbi:hypothetical protein AMJ80_09560, partial [bacterium SM23_31]